MEETNKKEKKRKKTIKEVMAVTPLLCVFCGDPHLSILGQTPEDTLMVLCGSCNKIFTIFNQSGRKLESQSSNKPIPTYL